VESARALRRLSARGRAVVAAAVLLVACGGAPKPAPKPAPEPSARARACRAYNARITGFLRRFDEALNELAERQQQAGEDATLKSDALGAFADRLVLELPELREIRSEDDLLSAAHRQLVAAIEQVSRGHEQLAAGYALGDVAVRKRAMMRLSDAWSLWSEASRAIITQCRDEQQPAAAAAQ